MCLLKEPFPEVLSDPQVAGRRERSGALHRPRKQTWVLRLQLGPAGAKMSKAGDGRYLGQEPGALVSCQPEVRATQPFPRVAGAGAVVCHFLVSSQRKGYRGVRSAVCTSAGRSVRLSVWLSHCSRGVWPAVLVTLRAVVCCGTGPSLSVLS